MKCLCCDSVLTSGPRKEALYCEHCGMVVDTTARTVKFIKRNQGVFDSYKALHMIAKFKPDIAAANVQLFSDDFDLSSLQFIYKDKRDVNNYVDELRPYLTGKNRKFDPNKIIISSQGFLSMNFLRYTAAGISSLTKQQGIPCPCIYDRDVPKFVWHLLLCHNYDDTDDYVKELVRLASIPDIELVKSEFDLTDEMACYFYSINGIHEKYQTVPFRENYTLEYVLLTAVNVFMDNIKEATARQDALLEKCSDKLSNDIKNTYLKAHPELSYGGQETFFNALLPNYVDDGWYDMITDGSTAINLLNYWEILGVYNTKFKPAFEKAYAKIAAKSLERFS